MKEKYEIQLRICTSFHTAYSTRPDSYDAYIASYIRYLSKKKYFIYRLQFHTCTNNRNSRSHVVSIYASVRREACRIYPISHRSVLLARYCTLQCESTLDTLIVLADTGVKHWFQQSVLVGTTLVCIVMFVRHWQ